MAVTTVFLFSAGNLAGRVLLAQRWFIWLGGVALTLAFASLVSLFLGPTPSDRHAIVARVRKMASGLRRTE
jgi:hypothetical protein